MSITINGTTGLTFTDSSTQNTAATGFGFKNRIINGAMMIDQRNAGASGTAGGYTVDRWNFYGSQASKGTWQQNLGGFQPDTLGFQNYLGFSSSSAYSILSTDVFYFRQAIEGYNISDLGWGKAGAQSVTLSFLVRSSLTGTFGGALRNSAADRSYPFSYTVNSANTWEQKSITIPGDTTGTWLTNSGIGIQIYFGLGVGSTLSGTAGAWAAGNYVSATGATSVVGTNGATFYITGVQLEKGSTATSFDYRPYGTELALCQRYYVKYGSDNADDAVGWGFGTAATSAAIYVCFPVKMRSTPSSNGSGLRLGDGVNSPVAVTSVSNDKLNTLIGSINANTASGLTAYRPYGLRTTSSSGYLEFSSEL